jgi:serine protease AprX
MRSKFAILITIAGLFATALSADVVTTLPSENVRAHSGKIFGSLNDLMVKTAQPIPVIVVLNAPATTSMVNRLQGLIGSFPVSYVYNVIPGFAAELTSRQIAALAQDATVHQIEYDAEVRANNGHPQRAYGITKARTDFLVDGDMDGDTTKYTKNDVVITILDTGIDTLHMDLDGGKVIAWKDFVKNKPAPYDDNGHGTFCASIAAGSGDASLYGTKFEKGVAPGAALVGVKVLDKNGSGKT